MWSRNSIPEHLSGKKKENSNSKRHMHSNVHSNTIYNNQDTEETQMFINWKKDKEYVVHIDNGIVPSYRKK